MKKALPIGVSDFGDMITGNGYYADKTLLIAGMVTDSDCGMLR